MKGEVKIILDKLNDINWYECKDLTGRMWLELSKEETDILKDYITDLQEERDMFERMSKWSSEVMFNYKSRNEKAIETLKDTSVDMPSTLLIETIDYARHILNGGDE